MLIKDHQLLEVVKPVGFSPVKEIRRWLKQKVKNRHDYEFFAGLNDSGQARWTIDLHQRAPVFVSPRQCYRSGVTYHSGLKRYLWCQIIAGEDTRFRGGFGIYESREPWGPWRTVFYTREWDVGPGETCSLPAKWMSADGRTCDLVFELEEKVRTKRGGRAGFFSLFLALGLLK